MSGFRETQGGSYAGDKGRPEKDSAKIGPGTPEGCLRERLGFLDRCACQLEEIASGLESVLGSIMGDGTVGPDRGCSETKDVERCIFAELERAQLRHQEVTSRLGRVMECLQRAI